MLATKQFKLALESFRTTMQSLDDSHLPPDERRKRQLDVQIMLTMMVKDEHTKNGKATVYLQCTHTTLLYNVMFVCKHYNRDYGERYNGTGRTESVRWTE